MKNRHAGMACLGALTLTVALWAKPHHPGQSTPANPPASGTQTDASSGDTKANAPAGEGAKGTLSYPASPEAQDLHKSLVDAKKKAQATGRLTCCISPPCEFCIAHMAMCQCRKNIASRKPVCRECKGGWEAGEGNIPNVKARTIKVMSGHQVNQEIKRSTKAMAKSAPKSPAK